MKLLNGQIVFEEITCWNCNGLRSHKIYPSCPNNNKAVGAGKKCPICGARNKHSHRSTTEKVVSCEICGKSGKVMETEYSDLPSEIFKQIPMEIGKRNPNPLENLLGIGIVGGATDYGRLQEFHAANGDTATIKKVLDDNGAGRQVLNFLREGKFVTKLILVIRDSDYSIYPDWS